MIPEKTQSHGFLKKIVRFEANVGLIPAYEYFVKIPIFGKVMNIQTLEDGKKLIISKLIISQTTTDNEMKYYTLVVY